MYVIIDFIFIFERYGYFVDSFLWKLRNVPFLQFSPNASSSHTFHLSISPKQLNNNLGYVSIKSCTTLTLPPLNIIPLWKLFSWTKSLHFSACFFSFGRKESEVAQSCLTLCDHRNCSLTGSSVHGIFRRKYWSGLPFPSSGALPDPGIKPRSPALQADSLLIEPPGKQ